MALYTDTVLTLTANTPATLFSTPAANGIYTIAVLNENRNSFYLTLKITVMSGFSEVIFYANSTVSRESAINQELPVSLTGFDSDQTNFEFSNSIANEIQITTLIDLNCIVRLYDLQPF